MNHEKLKVAIIELMKSAYWYGEDTGDYDMDWVHEKDWFKEDIDNIIKEIKK